MTSNESLLADRPLILWHGPGCQDGWTSAFAAWTVFGDGADYLPASYGQSHPDVSFRRVFILDFSYNHQAMFDLANDCASMVWIDHHDDELRHRLVGMFALPEFARKVQSRFNPAKCGARLSWEYFHPEQNAPYLIDVVESRDLWTWKAPFAREVDAWLSLLHRDFTEWQVVCDELTRPWFMPGYLVGGRDVAGEYHPTGLTEQAVDVGRGLLKYRQHIIDAHVRNAREIELFGYRVPCVNATVLRSEIGQALAEGKPFSTTYRDGSDGLRSWSLRCSEASSLDLAALAATKGGGGHRRAAGYEEAIP